MQLSMQCTWISLNLTRISNQARRWVEGVFSSSMYASSNQMCKREPPKAGHLLFISPTTKEPLATFTGLKSGAPDAQEGTTGRSTPCVWCSVVCHMSNFESARWTLTVTYGPPDATKWAPDASGTHRSRTQRVCQTHDLTGLVHREVCKPH